METDNVQRIDRGGEESISDCPGIILEENNENNKQKKPKRILHFCDGDLVESSSEDETDTRKTEVQLNSINPKSLNWMPWAWYQTVWAGSKVMNGCDAVGEALADFLGITSPKYQLEIDEYKRIQATHNEETARRDLEMGGWNDRHRNNLIANAQSKTDE